jgi:alanine racemase
MDLDEAVRPCWIEIDLGALAHNARTLQAHLGPETKIIAALKGDAYGHGIAPVARCLAACGVHSLATGSFKDAMAIRAAGVDLPILMFAGPLPEGIPRLLEHGLTPTIHDRQSAEAVSRAAAKPTRVYLKVDSGLGRLGVPVAEALAFVRYLRTLDHLVLDGVYTHLTFHDADGREWARERYAAFDALLEALAAEGIDVPVSQALASSALLAGLRSRANAVCPGSILYGMSPVSDEVGDARAYRPVVKAIKSRLIKIGTSEETGRFGVIPLGLADGYRSLAEGASADALLGGRRAPIRGTSLEYITLDLSDFADARVGDEVVLLGRSGDEEITLADLAAWQGASLHEVLLGFEGRLRARYFDDPQSPKIRPKLPE